MTIVNEITKLNTNLTNSYTAVSGKGGTLPSAQNFDNLATAIGTISGGSSPVITSLNVTPTTSAQTITAPSGTDGYSPVNVAAVTSSIDNNIVAGNIVSGVSILGVNGSVIELNATTKNVTPTTSSQTVTPTSPYNGFSSVTVSGVTAAIDQNITAGNIKKDVVILGVTGSYEGSGGGGGSGTTDVPLTRFKDDNNNEIGTHYMNFEDGNGNVFKVIVLDAQYRNASTQWCSNKNKVTNMPLYSNSLNAWWYDNAKETATQNTQLILNYCSAGSFTSTSCTHCRSQLFTIDGTIYYGQLPNMREVFDMWRHRVQIEQMDTSASSHSSTNFRSARNIWSSTQYLMSNAWFSNSLGNVNTNTKPTNNFACPVLEIPLS